MWNFISNHSTLISTIVLHLVPCLSLLTSLGEHVLQIPGMLITDDTISYNSWIHNFSFLAQASAAHSFHSGSVWFCIEYVSQNCCCLTHFSTSTVKGKCFPKYHAKNYRTGFLGKIRRQILSKTLLFKSYLSKSTRFKAFQLLRFTFLAESLAICMHSFAPTATYPWA